MKRIDTHVHLGVSKFSGVGAKESDVITAMDKYEISTSLVMPQPTLESIPDVHRRIAEMAHKYPGRIYGMACLDPWMSEEDYLSQVHTCMDEYSFVAIKLHPLGHNVSPLSPLCNKVYEAARHYNVPVIVHTGIGNPFSLPSLVIEPANRFPDVTFILAHAGFAVYTDEAYVAAKTCENIILEPSWCPTYTVRKMVDQIGSERMIMGSDHISNLPVELVKFNSIGLTDTQLEQIFYKTPQRVFNLNIKE